MLLIFVSFFFILIGIFPSWQGWRRADDEFCKK